MKVKIIKATLPSYWYSDKIGKVLTVSYYDKDNYVTLGYPDSSNARPQEFFILKEDTEVMEEECLWYDLKNKEPKEGDKIIGIDDGGIIKSGIVRKIGGSFYGNPNGLVLYSNGICTFLPERWTYFPDFENMNKEKENKSNDDKTWKRPLTVPLHEHIVIKSISGIMYYGYLDEKGFFTDDMVYITWPEIMGWKYFPISKKIEMIDRRDYDTHYIIGKVNELIYVINKLTDEENK